MSDPTCKQSLQVQPSKEAVERWKVDLWNAIDAYAVSVGGDPQKHVYGNVPRMNAVVSVESAIDTARAEDKAEIEACHANHRDAIRKLTGKDPDSEGYPPLFQAVDDVLAKLSASQARERQLGEALEVYAVSDRGCEICHSAHEHNPQCPLFVTPEEKR